VSIFNAAGATHVLADLVAWYPTGASYTPVNPTRVLDTRDGTGPGRIGPVGGGDGIDVKVTGVGGIPESGVGAVALNLTGTAPTDATYLTVYPGNIGPPCTSNLNLDAGQTAANLTLTAVDPSSGTVRIANAAGAVHVVADVAGWYPSTALPVPNPTCGGSLTTLWHGVPPQQNPYVPPPTQRDIEETDDGALRLATVEGGPPEQHISQVVLFDAAGSQQDVASVGAGGAASNGDSSDATMTPDGRYVAFSSVASNLVAGDTNGERDVFLRDRQAGTTVLVSRPSAGGANGPSDAPAISADGRYVAFRSAATNLVPGFDPGASAVFRWDRTTEVVTRISASFIGPYAGTEAGPPVISRDGSTIAYVASPRASEGFTLVDAERLFISTAGELAVDSAPALARESSVGVNADGTLVAYLERSPPASSGGLLPNRVMLWTRSEAPVHLADVPLDVWGSILLSADGTSVLLGRRSTLCDYDRYHRVTRETSSFRLLPQISGNTCYSNAWLHPSGNRALFAVSKFNYISGESETFVLRWTA
ncbi:MAG: TolB family protein, partial [Vicinamibacterales bacterium]